jgi:hypothetical protein
MQIAPPATTAAISNLSTNESLELKLAPVKTSARIWTKRSIAATWQETVKIPLRAGPEAGLELCRSAIDSRPRHEHARPASAPGGAMKLYRINKLSKIGGVVLKKKHVLAASDREAVQEAADSPDCPICEVLKDGQQVGSIV